MTLTPDHVIGLDLSLTATGVCEPDGQTFTIKTNPKHKDARLVEIVDTIVSVVVATPGRPLAVIEDLPTHGAHSIKPLAMVQGAVRVALVRLGVPYALLQPPVLKAFATGKGTANKTDMAMAAYKRAGLEFGDDNQCDAWWLRQAGKAWYGLPLDAEMVTAMPVTHTARLEKGAWPV